MAESKMAELKMEEFKMVAIIKLEVRMEWVKFFLTAEVRVQGQQWFLMDAIIKLSQNEWVKFCLNPRWQCLNTRMAEFKMADNHQVESEWMSEVFLCKCWELILASVSEFERKN